MKIQAVRKFSLDCAHRLLNHEGACAHNHGHSFIVEVFCEAEKLDSIGRVIDFSVIKKICGEWLLEHLDHGSILSKDDRDFIDFLKRDNNKVYVLEANPTSENIAAHLLEVFNNLLDPYHIDCTKIIVHETRNCRVEVIL